VACSDDGFVTFGDFPGNGFGRAVYFPEKMHDEGSAIKKLVHVKQNRLGVGLSEGHLAGFDCFTFVAIEPPKQKFVLLGGGAQDGHGWPTICRLVC
jgi:hypothetical protein